MKPCVYFGLIAALAVALPAMATTRYLSATGAGQYTTVAAAYAAASAGDTILVGPGSYVDNTYFNHARRLIWIGAGWDQTTITVGGYWQMSGVAASRSEFEGIRFEGAGSYGCLTGASGADSVAFRRCLFHSNGNSPVLDWSGNTGRLYVEDCILVQAYGANGIQVPNAACLIRNSVLAYTTTNVNCYAINGSATSGTLELYDNVFLSWSRIFNLPSGAQPIIAINNIFYDWGASPWWGTYPGTSTFDYNASSGPAVPGTNGIALAANPFLTYDPAGYYVIGTSNLHLDPTNGAVLINTGHPGMTDLDGSRSDFGIYGGPKPLVENGVPNYPWAVNIVLTPNLVGQGTPVNATATGRVGPQY